MLPFLFRCPVIELGFGRFQCRFIKLPLFLACTADSLLNSVGNYRRKILVFTYVLSQQLVLTYNTGNKLLVNRILLFPESDSFTDWY